MNAPRAWKIVLAVSTGIYAIFLPRFFVGYVNDDGVYMLAAQSLSQGRYAALNLPGQPPFIHYPPGFPLLLAPFVKVFAPHWFLLKGVPFLLIVLSGFLLWRLSKIWLSDTSRVILLVLYAFNPLTVEMSGLVTSESAFQVGLLLIFLVMQKNIQNPTPLGPWVLGVLLGWTCLIRAEAPMILPAVALGFIYAKRGSVAVRSVGIGLGIWLIYMVRNWIVAHTLNSHLSAWAATLTYFADGLQGSERLLLNGMRLLGVLFFDTILSFSSEGGEGFFIAVCGVGLAGLVLMTIGLKQLSREAGEGAAVTLSVFVFCLSYFLFHVTWLSVERRYLFCLVPFVLVALIRGAESVSSRFQLKPTPLRLACGFILTVYLVQLATQAFAMVTHRYEGLSQATFAWIRSETPSDSVFLVSGPETLYLYTGRSGFSTLAVRDREDFRYQVLKNGVDFILFRPSRFAKLTIPVQDPEALWKHRYRWCTSWPQAFERVYSNGEESRDCFRAKPDAAYVEAYEQYLLALESFRNGERAKGLHQLDLALQKEPQLVSAWNAGGVERLLEASELGVAEMHFLKALEIQPDYGLAALNLARLYRIQKREDKAAPYFQRAIEAIKKSGDFESLLPQIYGEYGKQVN